MMLLEQLSSELEALVARVTPGVVALQHAGGHGTGVVLAQDGYLLTNAHVVHRAGAIRARFVDAPTGRAEVVGADPQSDLAVLRADRGGLANLPLANMDQVQVGQLVVAVGHPFGFERSVSVGVVSALERRLGAPGGAVLDGLIQTDAAINPGNSGGPLVNARGEVVGINTAMLPFAQGIGFAIPASTASWVAAALIQHGEVRRRYLGIAARTERLGALAAEAGQAGGVRVLKIVPNAPADRGGLEENDLVLSVNGRPVRSVDELQRAMALEPAAEVDLGLWRRGRPRAARVRPRTERAAA